MWLKLIAFAALLEYILIRPKILPASENGYADFIGLVMCHSILAFFGKINMKDLNERQCKTVLWNGAMGGGLGYAWLLFHLKAPEREIHHLLVANLMILAGVLTGAWAERWKKGGRWRRDVGRRL
ncbi:Hypothetical predicted protein [Lecanosticta acicola]|uniref:DUF1294 domain-containing protein n=1 Tax=Lecanosticta acicola TaxID=111012 RepID=A0AAI9ECT1_9PEZI|nr:Hypothetical predicted protein [Lecanosticta acicola]